MISCLPISSSLQSSFSPQDNAKEIGVKPSGSRAGKICSAFLAAFLLIAGCAPVKIAQSAGLSTFHKGTLRTDANKASPKLIYVDCNSGAGTAPHLDQNLASALRAGKFRLVDSPSKAGYILHVNILKQGEVAPETLKSAVEAGYGGNVRFSGSGAHGMLVDALMVQRRVPEASQPARQKLKNISSRNALDSSKLRIGVMSVAAKGSAEEYSAAIASELARRIEK